MRDEATFKAVTDSKQLCNLKVGCDPPLEQRSLPGGVIVFALLMAGVTHNLWVWKSGLQQYNRSADCSPSEPAGTPVHADIATTVIQFAF